MKNNNEICNKIHKLCLLSFLHIHTKYLDLQACKKLAHGGVKAFDDYLCTSVNVKKCISYIVNENDNKLMKGKALRKHSLHEKTAASVLLKLFISGNE